MPQLGRDGALNDDPIKEFREQINGFDDDQVPKRTCVSDNQYHFFGSRASD